MMRALILSSRCAGCGWPCGERADLLLKMYNEGMKCYKDVQRGDEVLSAPHKSERPHAFISFSPSAPSVPSPNI